MDMAWPGTQEGRASNVLAVLFSFRCSDSIGGKAQGRLRLWLSRLSSAHHHPFITKRPQSLGETAGPGSLSSLCPLHLFP